MCIETLSNESGTVFINCTADSLSEKEDDYHKLEVEFKAALVITNHKKPMDILRASLDECGWNVPTLDDVIIALAKMSVSA